jgi:hypothetical protein
VVCVNADITVNIRIEGAISPADQGDGTYYNDSDEQQQQAVLYKPLAIGSPAAPAARAVACGGMGIVWCVMLRHVRPSIVTTC